MITILGNLWECIIKETVYSTFSVPTMWYCITQNQRIYISELVNDVSHQRSAIYQLYYGANKLLVYVMIMVSELISAMRLIKHKRSILSLQFTTYIITWRKSIKKVYIRRKYSDIDYQYTNIYKKEKILQKKPRTNDRNTCKNILNLWLKHRSVDFCFLLVRNDNIHDWLEW